MTKRIIPIIFFISVFSIAKAQTNHIVISQIYGAGGNSGALYKNDFVELFNPTTASVNLAGWSIQYSGATGATWGSNKVDLSGSIEPGKYFLIQLSGGTLAAGNALPSPDLSSGNINMSATDGKVALVNSTSSLSGNCPDFSTVVDFIGYGGADCKEMSVAPAPSVSLSPGKSIIRVNNGCTDVDNNSSDFILGTVSPRNSASAANFCNGTTITINTVSGLPFCVDGTTPANGIVQFTTVGSFSNTTLNAYLSDYNGSFTSATLVGSTTVNGTNPTGIINITVSATSLSSASYRLRIDAVNPSVTGIQSSAVEVINGAKNISWLPTSPNTGELKLNWNNPAGCYDEVLIIVKEGSAVTGTPSGDGSAYVADVNVSGNGTSFGGGKVVYKGSVSGQIISGLTDGTIYYAKAFTRRGTMWSSGIEINDRPRLMPRPGEILINQLSPGFNNSSDEYIELVNTTGKTFDLSELAIRYEANTGSPGVAGATLTGTMQPYSFWLLSPLTVINVGQTSSLIRDGYFADGFAASSGQVALIRKTDNAILDAVGYGTLSAGDYTEGTAASSPPASGGLKRIIDGNDNNNNSIDFVTVNNSDIDLRNSSSRLVNNGAVLPAGNFSKVFITGNGSLAGHVTLTNKAVIINGKLSLGNYNLTATQVDGGSSNSFIQTNSDGALIINNIGSLSKKFPVGNSTYNPLIISNGEGLNWSVRVADDVQMQSSAKVVSRTWQITPGGNPVTGAGLVFEYNDGDDRQISSGFNKNEDVQVWNYHTNMWQSAGLIASPTGSAGGTRTVTINNCMQFSPFVIANVSSPLAVTFSNVKAIQKPNGVHIEWSNLSEMNVNYYQVERSADGKFFSPLSKISPIKNNAGKADYSFEDQPLFPALVYYRIKALEKDGQVNYSRILSLNLNASQTKLMIVPNPVKSSQINLRMDNFPEGNYQLLVFNASGQILFSDEWKHSGGSLNLPVNISGLKTGFYSIEIIGKSRWKQAFVVL